LLIGLRLILKGTKANICSYIDNRGIDKVEVFIDSLDKNDQKKIIALLEVFSEMGIIRNKEKFNSLGDKLFEFKAASLRIICFFLPNTDFKTTILLNGFIKKSNKTPKSEIEIAKRRKIELIDLQKKDSLNIIGLNNGN